jgi:hypothetical protein
MLLDTSFMIKSFLYFGALATLSSSVMAMENQEPLVPKPSAAWYLDYAANSCRMTRQFGEGDDQITVLLTRFGPGEWFNLIIAGKPMKLDLAYADADIQFGPVEAVQSVPFWNGSFGNMPALLFEAGMRIAPMTPAEAAAMKSNAERSARSRKVFFTTDIAPIDSARQKAVKYVEIGKPMSRPIRLEIGSMQAPLAAMDKCIEELMTHWGIDVEKHKSLSATIMPANYPGDWVTTADYPADMLQKGRRANVFFRLNVGADGKVAACHIVATTEPKEFDDAVCKSIKKRARFKPARDAQGLPIASYYLNQVAFRLP